MNTPSSNALDNLRNLDTHDSVFDLNTRKFLPALRSRFTPLASHAFEGNFRKYASDIWMTLHNDRSANQLRLEWQRINNFTIPTIASLEFNKARISSLIHDFDDNFNEDSITSILSLQNADGFTGGPWTGFINYLRRAEVFGISALLLHAVWLERHSNQLEINKESKRSQKFEELEIIRASRTRIKHQRLIDQQNERLTFINRKIDEYELEKSQILSEIQQHRNALASLEDEVDDESLPSFNF